ncbi:hypothetical protein EI94DRAFT_1696194 [Lactarius quietus]|nr:hypothetical protein EI94DRAFT_1696194 [Lactarius quietus]
MAKAKTNSHSIAGPSSSSLCLVPSSPPLPNLAGPHLRSSRRRSPGIFAFLATLSASQFSVHAHPLDPAQTALPFLYPSFIHQATPSVAKRSLPSSADATSTTPSPPPPPPPPPSKCNQEQINMPDKYVLGDDGYWYKTDWSLYGSTQCPGPCLPTPTPGQNADDPTSSGDFDMSSLPTGWDIPSTSSRHGMVIILSLSVALAVFIVAMMIFCVFWRRKLIPKKDPEKKRGQSSDFADDDASRSIREAKAAQRRWTKAVSRWRTNVRFSFRRRRTDRAITRNTTYSTSGQEGEGMITVISASSSRSHSPTPTLRSRASTSQDGPSSSAASVHSAASRARPSRASSPQPQVASPYDVPPRPPSPPPMEPPAYHPQPAVPTPPPTGDHSPPYTHSDCCPPSSSKLPASSSSSSQPGDTDNGHLGPLSGHVATDDKALLSRRAALASAPSESSSRLEPSAPSIDDDDDFEFSSESRPSSPVCDAYDSEQRPPYVAPASLLPPPPSKGKLNYDIATIEPGLGPSAPPFEESVAVPSAPPLDLDVPVPSAPAMVTEREDDRQE